MQHIAIRTFVLLALVAGAQAQLGGVQANYVKAPDTQAGDQHGRDVAVSDQYLVVGAPFEDSNALGVNASNANLLNDASLESGIAYVYRKVAQGTGFAWQYECALKPAVSHGPRACFGAAVAVSGQTIAVGAPAGGLGAGFDSGAVFVYSRGANGWVEAAQILQPGAHHDLDALQDGFGTDVALEGGVLVVGAPGEDGATNLSNAFGAMDSGAAYVFEHAAGSWTLKAALKAGNGEAGDAFGSCVGVAGGTIAVGAPGEDGIGGGMFASLDNNGPGAGAAYAFELQDGAWIQRSYLKASNKQAGDQFGASIAVRRTSTSSDGFIVVGAPREDGAGLNVGGDQSSNAAVDSGAAYVFRRYATSTWEQTAYLKASNTGANDQFGSSVAIHANRLLVGAPLEASNSTACGAGGSNNAAPSAGAAYAFVLTGLNWGFAAYLKAANAQPGDMLGGSVAVHGGAMIVGASGEDSAALLLNGNMQDNSRTNAGAAYQFRSLNAAW